MNSTKKGRLFAILMIALIAYGFSSTMCILLKPSFAVELPTDILPSEEKIQTMGNPGFEPVTLRKHVLNNTTNITNTSDVTVYIDNRTNQSSTPFNRNQD